jgi:HAMP domain-containing protein
VAGEWNVASDRTAGLIREVEVAQQQQLATDGAALAAGARSAALRDGIVVALLVVLTVLMLVFVARSLVRPLRTLRTTAFQIARSRLPATIEGMAIVDGRVPDVRVKPIGVDTDEEIGEVARAFDAVHAAAVRLAGEQALLRRSVNDSFVNLARRSQGLVTRQLRLIDQMEERERDSDQLGELFKIDHLATRMRRNSENLLVLAGDSGRQEQSTPDTPAEDVLGAAVSEIELYRMVAVGPAPDVAVRGGAVADLAHLVAELLENATTFSALDATVSLDARVRSDGAMVVDIVDEGVGLPGARLAKINAELAEPPLFDAAVSRHMGLFVVGRLARRHGRAAPAVHGPRPGRVRPGARVRAGPAAGARARAGRGARLGRRGPDAVHPGGRRGRPRQARTGALVAADGRRGRRTIGRERPAGRGPFSLRVARGTRPQRPAAA